MRVVGVYTCCPGCGLVLCSLIVVSLLGGFFPALVVGMFPVLWCFLVFMLCFLVGVCGLCPGCGLVLLFFEVFRADALFLGF